MADKSFHLVIRFSDNLFGVGDVVARHNAIVSKHGYVWFGKIGSTFSETRIEMLKKQINEGIPTSVYLIKGNRKMSSAYQAPLIDIAKELNKNEAKKTPDYYREKKLVQYMKVWVKIGEIFPIEMSALGNLKAINSIFPIQETLVRSSSGYFLVHESKSIF